MLIVMVGIAVLVSKGTLVMVSTAPTLMNVWLERINAVEMQVALTQMGIIVAFVISDSLGMDLYVKT